LPTTERVDAWRRTCEKLRDATVEVDGRRYVRVEAAYEILSEVNRLAQELVLAERQARLPAAFNRAVLARYFVPLDKTLERLLAESQRLH
jgi:hypothetical protein